MYGSVEGGCGAVKDRSGDLRSWGCDCCQPGDCVLVDDELSGVGGVGEDVAVAKKAFDRD